MATVCEEFSNLIIKDEKAYSLYKDVIKYLRSYIITPVEYFEYSTKFKLDFDIKDDVKIREEDYELFTEEMVEFFKPIIDWEHVSVYVNMSYHFMLKHYKYLNHNAIAEHFKEQELIELGFDPDNSLASTGTDTSSFEFHCNNAVRIVAAYNPLRRESDTGYDADGGYDTVDAEYDAGYNTDKDIEDLALDEEY
jgi:hypothetical protein